MPQRHLGQAGAAAQCRSPDLLQSYAGDWTPPRASLGRPAAHEGRMEGVTQDWQRKADARAQDASCPNLASAWAGCMPCVFLVAEWDGQWIRWAYGKAAYAEVLNQG